MMAEPHMPFHGFLNINKPAGMTSRQVTNLLVRLTHQKRIGHCGTLDPFATGVLVLAFGRCTRLVEEIHRFPKTYRAVLKLGSATDTQDCDGEETETQPVPKLTQETVRDVFSQFLSEYTSQIPPMYSAVKVDGKRAYDLARKGEAPKLEPKAVTLHSLELLAMNEDSLTFDVQCSTGTYVRTLGVDIARTLGTLGHLTDLQRRSVGAFSWEETVTLEALQLLEDPDDFPWRNPGDALPHIPRLPLDNAMINRVQHGQSFSLPIEEVNHLLPFEHGTVLLYTQESRCEGLAEYRKRNDEPAAGIEIQPRFLLH